MSADGPRHRWPTFRRGVFALLSLSAFGLGLGVIASSGVTSAAIVSLMSAVLLGIGVLLGGHRSA